MTRREYLIFLLENKANLILNYIKPCRLINCPLTLIDCNRCTIEWLEDDDNRLKLINELKNNEIPRILMEMYMYKSFCKEDNFEDDVNCKYYLQDWLNANISYE